MDKNIFEQKIQPLLTYIGVIGASITAVAYVIIVCVMIVGFSYHQATGAIVFALVNAVVGLIIMQFLKVQGMSFAEHLPENEEIVTRYYNTKTKDKKPHNLLYFWVTTGVVDVIVKGLSVVVSTAGLIYIVIEGSNDYNMLLLAVVNLLLFVCFGLLSLNKAYKFYNNEYIPYVKQQLEELK